MSTERNADGATDIMANKYAAISAAFVTPYDAVESMLASGVSLANILADLESHAATYAANDDAPPASHASFVFKETKIA